jgi:hypothetical protein
VGLAIELLPPLPRTEGQSYSSGLLPVGHAIPIFENTPIDTEQASVRFTQRITDFGLLDVVRVAGHRRARTDLGAVLTVAMYGIWIW